MGDDEWVEIAKVDDAVVAELLLRLKGVNMVAQPPMSTPKQALLIEWRVRQRRSKAVTIIQPTKDQAPRDSPSTPLSFSGGGGGAMSVSFGGGIGSGASGSGGGGLDCSPEEDSSALSIVEYAPKTSSMSRSKVIRSSESNTIRRSKKKKLQTLIELKAEDEFLARERLQLQTELESVRQNLEKERARNVNFKKIKLQQQQQQQHMHMGSVQSAEDAAVILQHTFSVTGGFSEPKIEEALSEFVLPDLNLPLEENC